MNIKEGLYQIYKIRWVQHFSFWTVFMLLMFGRYIDLPDDKNLIDELIFEFSQLFFIVIFVYFNLRYLIPKFWNRGRYLIYVRNLILWELALILLLSFLLHYLPEVKFKLIAKRDPIKLLIIHGFKINIFVLSSSLFHFVKEWIKLKDENLKFTERAQEQLEAELSLLKAQVNPHFLFNTLNNIYSMSLYDSAKTPEMILKLSQLISYMLYECKDALVSLEKELLFIENYIELEALRVEDVAEIKFLIDGDPEGIKIPPLLFIPLIENAFKHGVVSELDKSLIRIEISVVSDSIGLQIENPWEEDEQDDLSKHKGLGVENVQKRLSLLYPNKYILKCEKRGKSYITDLKIKL